MVSLQVWGNHHCLHQTEFKRTLSHLISRRNRFNEPIYNLKSDQKLNGRIINKIKVTLLKQNKAPQIHVFILGDVDLEQERPIKDLCEAFDKLTDLTSLHQQTHFVVCSIIPQIPYETDSRTDLFNRELYKQLKNKKKVTLVKVDRKLSQDDFENQKDLNENGAVKLAQFVAKAVDTIPRRSLKCSN